MGKTLYSKNEYYFSEMSLQSSYWAGFLAADGYIDCGDNSLYLSLADKDIDTLKRFKDNLSYTGPIKYHTKKMNNSSFVQGKVSIYSAKRYIKDLEELYNITSNKTFTIRPPNVDGDNKLAYLIGLIDGDGSVGYYGKRNKNYKLSIATASPLMADWLSDELGILGERPQGAAIGVAKRIKDLYIIRLECNYARVALYKLKSISVDKLDRKWDYNFYIPDEDVRVRTAKIHINTARQIKLEYTGERGEIANLSRKFNLSYNIVYSILTGRTWKSLDNE